MENQNVTISLPKNLLRQAKHLAIEQGISLSGLLVQLLEEATRKDDEYKKARERHLALLDTLDLGSMGKAQWSRSELHER
ncbi:hypothetical protein MGLY_17220 [Neomoorella glycerini]|uniref:CopG family transcriptional regulator n=1 Tax=Neomoorella glycerini TaxID=55779 RepID=A0A6I5ZS14_9FIRM|nr:CopG family transcriptional regulator [Moorella glycerini]QGP92347.1 hypothetical protein MGLY_17220 [Moorella glycerini]